MKIPFVDLKKQYQILKKDIDKSIKDVIAGSRFIQGDEVGQFEKEFAGYLNIKHCLGVGSGTEALILGIRALGLYSQDEVIVPANTFIATALGITENNLKPVFVDIDESDFGINLSDLRRKITHRTKAVIIVHLFGQPDKIEEIKKIISQTKRKIYLIEDCCQAHGAKYKGKSVGNFGVFGAFSFYPGKNLGAYGDAGAIVTKDDRLEKKYRQLREYGQKKKYYHEILGINSRLDTIQAAILRVKLRHLDDWNEKRQRWAAYFNKSIINKKMLEMKTPQIYPQRKSVFHLYVIRTKKRDELSSYLNKNNIQSLIHYPIPLHLQHAFKYLGYHKGDMPIVEKIAGEILSLPIFPELNYQEIDFMVNKIQEFFKEKE